MNKIKEVNFKDSQISEEALISDKQKVEKYKIQFYEPFEWYSVPTEGKIPESRGGHSITVVG